MAAPNIQYRKGLSAAHRAHPLVKLEIFLLVVLSAFVFGPSVSGILAVLLFFSSLNSGVFRRSIAPLLKPLPLFIILILGAHLFLVRNGDTAGTRAANGLFQGLRVFALLLAGGYFLAVTDPLELSEVLVRLIAPLRRAGFRGDEMSLVLMIVLGFIPQMSAEAGRIRKTHLVRCGRRKWFSRKTGGVVPFIAPLVASILRRSREMDMALTARYYGRGHDGGTVRGLDISPVDAVIMITAAGIFLAGIYAQY